MCGGNCVGIELHSYVKGHGWYTVRNTYGITKCSNDDEFNVKIGEKIARRRAIIKYTKYAKRELRNTIKMLNKQLDDCEQGLLKVIILERRFKEILKELGCKY